MNTFQQFGQKLGLKPEILKSIKELYYREPTPIQLEAIPLALEGRDLIGQAQTGTGKTAAFVIPLLQQIDPDKQDVQALILTPTRELAIQITEDVRRLGKYLEFGAVCLHGGRDVQSQMNKVQRGVQVVIGTPGRILDHLRRQTLHFGRIKILVLDEADKMLEMGFLEDVETILAHTASRKQMLLYSATMPEQVKKLAHRFMFQPPHIRIEHKQVAAEQVLQYFITINQSEKPDRLMQLLPELKPYLCLIFANTQKRVEQITEQLQLNGYEAEALHGGLAQNKRERLLQQFRDVKFQYLVCTDVASRGLDVEGVTHVINYDLPSDTESYIHRVGRTGRAGNEGTAISFITPRQKVYLKKLEKAIRQRIEERFLSRPGTITEIRANKSATTGRRVPDTEHTQQAKLAGRKSQTEQESEKKMNKQVKPGYKKKMALAKKRKEQKEKRKRIQRQVNQRLKEMRKKGR